MFQKDKTESWTFTIADGNLPEESLNSNTANTTTSALTSTPTNAIASDKSTNNQVSTVNKYQDIFKNQIVKFIKKIKTVPSPKSAVFSIDNKEIWITSALNKTWGASIYDVATGNNNKNINLQNGGGVEVIFNKDGSKAYISQMETASIYEIDAKTKNILRTFKTSGSWTKILALSNNEKTLFASNWSSDDVSLINLETGKEIKKIKTVKTPRGLYPSIDGKYLYVAGFDNGDLQKINLEDDSSKTIFTSGGALRHMAADNTNKKLYISDMAKNIVWVMDMKTDNISKFANTDNNPNTIKLSPDNKMLFVSCRGVNASLDNYTTPGPEWGSIMIFDTLSGKMLDAIIGGNQPTALDISSDGKLLVFSNFLDGNIELYQVPDYQVFKNGKGGISDIYHQYIYK